MIKKNSPGRFPETRLLFLALVLGMCILIEVCYLASIAAILLFYGSVIISRKHLKRSICQGHCVYSNSCYNKRSVADSRKFE